MSDVFYSLHNILFDTSLLTFKTRQWRGFGNSNYARLEFFKMQRIQNFGNISIMQRESNNRDYCGYRLLRPTYWLLHLDPHFDKGKLHHQSLEMSKVFFFSLNNDQGNSFVLEFSCCKSIFTTLFNWVTPLYVFMYPTDMMQLRN